MNPALKPPTIAVGLVSAAALAYEVLLIRLFAIVHWHHLVATAIGLALLGYGISGTFLTLVRSRIERRFSPLFVGNALGFALATPACVHFAQRLPFDPQALVWDPAQVVYLATTFLILMVPLFAAANCVGLALARFPEAIPRLYGYDLVGAGIGAVGVLAGLLLAPPAAMLLAVSLAGLLVTVTASWMLRWRRRGVMLVAGAAAIAVGLWGPPQIVPATYKDLARALSVIGAQRAAELHGAAGSVTVVRNAVVPVRTAPGLSLQSGAVPPPQSAVFVDGDAVGTLADWHGDTDSARYLADLTSAMPYQLLRSPRVVVLNAGVGPAVAQALTLGASEVVAVEPNPQLVALRCKGHTMTGGGCADSRIRWRTQAPRAYLAEASAVFDLVVLELSADPAGLDALDIGFDATTEALQSYLERLSPHGLLAIEGPTRVPPRLALRMLATARDALLRSGVDAPGPHLAMIRGWQRFSLLVARAPLDAKASSTLRTFARGRGFDLIWLPDIRADEANRYQRLTDAVFFQGAVRILEQPTADAIDQSDMRLAPASDDRPFPHRFTRWHAWWQAISQGDRAALAQLDLGLHIGVTTLVLVSVIAFVLILLPLGWMRRPAATPGRRQPRLRTLFYFGSIGFAFLFIEIGWIQRLQLFVGHPVYATTLVLAAFLVFAGLGSLWAQRRAAEHAGRLLATAISAIALFGLAYLLLLPDLLARYAGMSLVTRGAIVLMLLAPLAFAMGMPFPLGLRGLGTSTPDLVPWAWAINGCASVIAAVATPLLATEIGFSGLMVVAMGAYLLLPFIRLHTAVTT